MPHSNIKPTFSVHHQLSQLHHWILVKHPETVLVVADEMEHTLMADGAGQTYLFVGLQVLSAFLPRLERYREIAKRVGMVYVLGVADVRPESLPVIDNLAYVPLPPSSQLARERFWVCGGLGFANVLSSEERPDMSASAVWIFDPVVSSRLAARLAEQVGVRVPLMDESAIDLRGHVHHMNYLAFRMMSRLVGGETENLGVSQEVRGIIKHTLQPYMADVLGNQSAGV